KSPLINREAAVTQQCISILRFNQGHRMARNRLKDLRRRVYQVLEQGPVGDHLSTWIDRLLVALILINLIAIALESMPEYAARYAAAFALIEYVSLVVFTI